MAGVVAARARGAAIARPRISATPLASRRTRRPRCTPPRATTTATTFPSSSRLKIRSRRCAWRPTRWRALFQGRLSPVVGGRQRALPQARPDDRKGVAELAFYERV